MAENPKKLLAKHMYDKADKEFWQRYNTHQASFISATEPTQHWRHIRDKINKACQRMVAN